MAFIDDMQERDLALLQALDGREVIYTPVDSMPRTISGMLQAFTEMTGGETVDVVVAKPMLSVRTIDIPDIQTDDQFTIDGQDYQVVVISPDSEGITELTMEKL